MNQGQNWNDCLEYSKLLLGVPVNLLEIPDDELIGYLRNQVLTLFSQYAPFTKYAYLTDANRVSGPAGSPIYKYKIPVEPGTYIVDVFAAYPTKDISVIDMYGGALINAQAAMDLVIANSYIDAVRSMQTRNTWEFFPPDIIVFDLETLASVVVYHVPHTVLNTIRPDLYQRCFKPLCLAFTKLWVSAMRSKFENLATPFGPLNLNYDRLASEGQTEREAIIQILETIPPDVLIEVS